MAHPYLEEVYDVLDLSVGKCIRCNYVAGANQLGVFSNLGQETGALIPPTSSNTPNGDFYFICVGYDYLGRLKLVSDRNIQYYLAWDTLNLKGAVYGMPLKIGNIEDVEFSIRLLTGGTSATDLDNEYDNIIVNGDLGGLITSGDDNIWNWSGLTYGSAISTSNPRASDYKFTRGGTSSVSLRIDTKANTVYNTVGYRPVMLVDIQGITRTLIKSGDKVYKVENGILSEVSVLDVNNITDSEFKTLGRSFVASKELLKNLVSPELLVWTTSDKTKALEFTKYDILIRYLVSFDDKQTWYSNKGSWQLTDIASIGSEGMTANDINVLTNTALNSQGKITDVAVYMKSNYTNAVPSITSINVEYIYDEVIYGEVVDAKDLVDNINILARMVKGEYREEVKTYTPQSANKIELINITAQNVPNAGKVVFKHREDEYMYRVAQALLPVDGGEAETHDSIDLDLTRLADANTEVVANALQIKQVEGNVPTEEVRLDVGLPYLKQIEAVRVTDNSGSFSLFEEITQMNYSRDEGTGKVYTLALPSEFESINIK